MEEGAAFNPGVGAVQVQAIVAGAIKDAVDYLEDRSDPGSLTLAAGEVDGVVKSVAVAEITIAQNAMTSSHHSADAMHQLRLGAAQGQARAGIARESGVLDDKRSGVRRDVFNGRQTGS